MQCSHYYKKNQNFKKYFFLCQQIFYFCGHCYRDTLVTAKTAPNPVGCHPPWGSSNDFSISGGHFGLASREEGESFFQPTLLRHWSLDAHGRSGTSTRTPYLPCIATLAGKGLPLLTSSPVHLKNAPLMAKSSPNNLIVSSLSQVSGGSGPSPLSPGLPD